MHVTTLETEFSTNSGAHMISAREITMIQWSYLSPLEPRTSSPSSEMKVCPLVTARSSHVYRVGYIDTVLYLSLVGGTGGVDISKEIFPLVKPMLQNWARV